MAWTQEQMDAVQEFVLRSQTLSESTLALLGLAIKAAGQGAGEFAQGTYDVWFDGYKATYQANRDDVGDALNAVDQQAIALAQLQSAGQGQMSQQEAEQLKQILRVVELLIRYVTQAVTRPDEVPAAARKTVQSMIAQAGPGIAALTPKK